MIEKVDKRDRATLFRARLAEAAVADLYTQRRMISAGLIPPGLVFGGAGFAAH